MKRRAYHFVHPDFILAVRGKHEELKNNSRFLRWHVELSHYDVCVRPESKSARDLRNLAVLIGYNGPVLGEVVR